MTYQEVDQKDMNEFGRIYNCCSCGRQNCVHREAYRRLPTSIGGLDLCPGHEPKKEAEENA